MFGLYGVHRNVVAKKRRLREIHFTEVERNIEAANVSENKRKEILALSLQELQGELAISF